MSCKPRLCPAGGPSSQDAHRSEDVWFAFYQHEISLAQLRAMLLDLGWTTEEIEDGLDGDDDDD